MKKEISSIDNLNFYCFDGNIKFSLHNEFEKLKKEIRATYIFYSYLDTSTNNIISFFSSDDWQYQMINNKLILECPLVKYGLRLLSNPDTSSFCTIWNYIKPANKKELDVVGIRNELNISNGFSFSQQYNGIKEGLGLAGDAKDDEFYTQFILNPNIITKIFTAIRNILISEKNSQFNFLKTPNNLH